MAVVRQALRDGAYDYLIKPFELEELANTVDRALQHYHLLKQNEAYRLNLEKMVKAQTREILETRDLSLITLAKLAESRDSDTGLHLERTMKIESRAVSGVTILDIHGKVTLGEGSAAIRGKVAELLNEGNKKILLNLGDVSYVDSSGIGELVSSFTTVSNQGGQLKLLNLTKKLEELLAITKLLTVFDSYDDEQKAVESFS